MLAQLLLAVALTARGAEPDALGGHSPEAPEKPAQAAVAAEDRRAVLEEMWQRRLLNPDQTVWSPADAQLLLRIRESEADALAYLKRRFGQVRPWTAAAKRGVVVPRPLLTKEGFEKYQFHLTQDAIEYFESKDADAKWVLKMTDWDGRRLFDGEGKITPAGARVYQRAKLKLEVYWKSPNGEVFGTRRPPK